MTLLLDIPGVVDLAGPQAEAAARHDLRAQIARLQARGACAPSAASGPRLLTLGELEALRDTLAGSSGRLAAVSAAHCPLDEQAEARGRLEAMFANPRGHKFATVSRADAGLPGCGAYRVRPRLGIIGMLAGWWQITLSSGCP
ncbi:MAG: hypothetical protein ABIO51_02560 [Solirubrobacteraceae bacterium]